jgi:hypothetical protein
MQRGLVAAALGVVLAASFAAPSSAVTPVATGELAGSQGTDTRLPSTASQVTINGRGAFANLAVTVNQTRSLNNQAISVSWTGGTPTVNQPNPFNANFVQIMQCWGDDDGTVPANPGPPPEQCYFGASAAKYGSAVQGTPPSFSWQRVISATRWQNFNASLGVVDSRTSWLWRKFRSVSGEEVGIQFDPTFIPGARGDAFWLNPFFNVITTNEIAASAIRKDGTGEALFEVQTGIEASGLGCGQRVLPQLDGTKAVPKCWLVVVPRGTPDAENVGTPFAQNADEFGVATSALSPAAWANRISIPLGFNPVDSPCKIGADERRLTGTELALRAIATWQPTLCLTGNLPPYSFAPASDATARQQLVSGSFGSPKMVAISRPVPTDQIDPANPVVYSPLAISGLTIGFNLERFPMGDAGESFQDLRATRVARLNLTPRLVAKLLTQSYRSAVTFVASNPGYAWLAGNAATVATDPDFVQFNPEFAKLLVADGRTSSGLVLPAGNSDAAEQVWRWIFADPEASAWLKGTPDPWGMKVNPAYAATASLNTLGQAFGTPMPNSFPKADPYCYQSPPLDLAGTIAPPAICSTDWMPYSRGYGESARVGRVATDGAKIEFNPFAVSSSDSWKTVTPQGLGARAMFVVSDTPSASLFGLQMAALSRAGDNGVNRTFIAPTQSTLLSAVSVMKSPTDPTVLEPSTSGLPDTAYPLATVTYAAATPVTMSAQERLDYAAFLDYAVGKGQTPGPDFGQLPPGYAPLPQPLKDKAAAAIVKVKTLQAPVVTTTTTPTTRPTYRPPTTYPDYTYPDYTVPVETIPIDPGTTDSTTTTTATGATTSTTPSASTTTIAPATAVTPTSPTGRGRFAVAALGVVALLSAAAVLEITKRPRRRPDSVLVEASLEAGA